MLNKPIMFIFSKEQTSVATCQMLSPSHDSLEGFNRFIK